MRVLSGILASLLLAGTSSLAMANATTFAKVEVKLDNKIAAKAAGIRTLYITLYDAESKMPMPYGAIKVDLDKDAKGAVFKGTLDDKNVMVMNSAAASMKSMRIKAKLDKDGSAGPDAAGDLVGIVDGVKVGSDVSINIDKEI